MHVFPQLRKLEEKYRKELVVIGVHSAKFISEKETQSIRKAILRHNIQHPVINDKDFIVWQDYGIRAWPTIMLIDPWGKIFAGREGEISFDAFDRIITDMLSEYDREDHIDRRKMDFKEEVESSGVLSFPGKVLAVEERDLLFISDTNHNRIIVASLNGDVKKVIGSGEVGLRDGDIKQAQFNHPQGLALKGNTLYVADTENHAIRKVYLIQDMVETVAGVGEQAEVYHDGGPGPRVLLNSPWDLAIWDNTLYIAMAGFHQLWAFDLASGLTRPHAGTGNEGIVDGTLDDCWLAQPSGIVAHDGALYFADSETSSIRIAGTAPSGVVTTIVGKDLFAFGDVDGVGLDVLLQHPIGITYYDGVVYIADTYNNKIKIIDPATRSSKALIGNGAMGQLDGSFNEATFYEPSGLSAAKGKLYIADTNNHAIRVADLSTMRVETLELKGL